MGTTWNYLSILQRKVIISWSYWGRKRRRRENKQRKWKVVFQFLFLSFKISLSILIFFSHTLLFLTYVSKGLPMAYWANTVNTHRCSRSKIYSIVFLHYPSMLPPGKHQLLTSLSCVRVHVCMRAERICMYIYKWTLFVFSCWDLPSLGGKWGCKPCIKFTARPPHPTTSPFLAPGSSPLGLLKQMSYHLGCTILVTEHFLWI